MTKVSNILIGLTLMAATSIAMGQATSPPAADTAPTTVQQQDPYIKERMARKEAKQEYKQEKKQAKAKKKAVKRKARQELNQEIAPTR